MTEIDTLNQIAGDQINEDILDTLDSLNRKIDTKKARAIHKSMMSVVAGQKSADALYAAVILIAGLIHRSPRGTRWIQICALATLIGTVSDTMSKKRKAQKARRTKRRN